MYNKESELSKLPSEEFHQTYIEHHMKEHLDHGKRHYGKYAAYLRVSTDMQDVEGQEFAIKQYLMQRLLYTTSVACRVKSGSL